MSPSRDIASQCTAGRWTASARAPTAGREVLLDLKRRGLKQDPKLAIGDGAPGCRTALREVCAMTREQRCWVHKAMNVLNAMPKSVEAKAKAKAHPHDIHWPAGHCAALSREAGRPRRTPRQTPPSTSSPKPVA